MIGAIDIGGTKIAAGVVDAAGRVAARLSCPAEPERGFEHALGRMRDMLCRCAREVGARLEGVGVGCTGPVDPFRGTVEEADLLPGWNGAPLAASLEESFQVPVALENDADAVALAEAAWGMGASAGSFVYVTIGTGIGAGMVIGGKLYRGAGGAHPEIGHIAIDSAGPPCYCGARGCWESLAGGPALAAWVGRQAPGSWTAERICRLAETGDELCRKAVEREAYYIGLGLAVLVIAFCPDAIALGGGLMHSAHLLLDGARTVVRGNCRMVPHSRVRIGRAALGADAPLAGAARAWYNRFHQHAS